MKKTALCLLLAHFVFAVPAIAQQPNGNQTNEKNDQKDEKGEKEEESTAEEGEGNKRFWQATVPGGSYMVALDHITSVSIHEYVLNAQLLVNEVVIDTDGRALVRFYHVASVLEGGATATGGRIVERGRELIDRAGQRAKIDYHNLAQKDYPTTSHAGMIEYRILNLADLKALYKNAQSAWESGKGKTITLH